jgi:RNA recognition motif-containing protein
MSQKKLYVGSLPYTTTEEELHEIFSPFGEVASVRIISDRMTGRSKGFGFVEMVNGEEADKAIQELHGASLKGRTLIVNEARPEEKRERAPRSEGNFRPRNRQ